MESNITLAVGFMFFWLLILTVAFVIHWIKIERNLTFDKHLGSKVSDNLKEKVLGKQ